MAGDGKVSEGGSSFGRKTALFFLGLAALASSFFYVMGVNNTLNDPQRAQRLERKAAYDRCLAMYAAAHGISVREAKEGFENGLVLPKGYTLNGWNILDENGNPISFLDQLRLYNGCRFRPESVPRLGNASPDVSGSDFICGRCADSLPKPPDLSYKL